MTEGAVLVIELMTVADLNQIQAQSNQFWDDRMPPLLHPMFLNEFGDTAYVIRDGAQVIAYMFAFYAQTGPYGYIHHVAVRDGRRGYGLARRLYAHFETAARARGCRSIKAITSTGNHGSIAFHGKMGYAITGHTEQNGVRVSSTYVSPAANRIIFEKVLA